MGTKLTNTERIGLLESEVSKMREEAESNRVETGMQLQEILESLKSLKNERNNKKKKNEPDNEESSASDDDKTKGSGIHDHGGKNKDPLRDARKIKMPIFSGEDAYGWIYRVERYFEVQGISKKDQLRAAGLCMEDSALAWYRWVEARSPCRTWEKLKKKLLVRFQPSYEGNIYEQFLSIHQAGTARDYVCEFEKLAGQMLDLPEEVLEGTFIKGLKPELRSAVRVSQPKSLSKAMKVAVMIEENKNGGVPKTGGARGVPGSQFRTGTPTLTINQPTVKKEGGTRDRLNVSRRRNLRRNGRRVYVSGARVNLGRDIGVLARHYRC